MKSLYRLILITVVTHCLSAVSSASELQVYTSKNASYIKPLFDEYSRETGIAISYLIAPTADLIARLKLEGRATGADVLLATGASYFSAVENKDLFASIDSRTLERNVPKHLQSEDNRWFSLSKRARVFVYNSDKVLEKSLSSYAGLSSADWEGKLCLRTSKAEYTQSLVAMLIEREGRKKVRNILQGWVDNLALAPFAEDTQILEAIEKGLCDVGIVNSYYYARVLREQPDTRLKLFWPDQDGAGVHMNVTAMAITTHAPNKDLAIDLLEWLSRKRPQSHYGRLSMEYPVHPKVYPAREVARWGKFKEDTTHLSRIGVNLAAAVELLDQVGY